MSARARSYQRVPQAEVNAIPSAADVSSIDDDDMFEHSDDGDEADNEGDLSESDSEKLRKKKQQKHRSQQAAVWSTRLHAFLWIVLAGSIAYAIDFFHVIFNDPRVKRGYFNVALVCTGVNICITAYLAIYLPYIKRIHLEWNVYCPRMIPTATIVGGIGTFCYICAFWPVWGLFTPGLLALFFIGMLMTAHFLPSI